MIERKSQACPSGPELERAFFEGSEGFLDHMTGCEACRTEWQAIRSLSTLASELEGPALESSRIEDVRTTMLAQLDRQAAAPPPSASSVTPRRLAIGGALALAAAAALFIMPRLQSGSDERTSAMPTAETFRGDVQADGRLTRFDRVSAQPRELVRLHAGTVSVAVEKLEPGESFVVVTDDAEIEVRGTRFSVSAEGGRLVGVVVHEGRVVVRSAGGERMLTAGEQWEVVASNESQPDEAAHEPSRIANDGARPIDRTAPNKRPPRKEEVQKSTSEAAPPLPPSAYESGWKHLRSNRYLEAAAEFERATKAAETKASRADAIYWASISHYRAGKKERARVLLRRFLADHRSDRRGAEVATMLGWLEVDRSDLDAANRLFKTGARSQSAKVRRSAEEGLTAIEKARAIR